MLRDFKMNEDFARDLGYCAILVLRIEQVLKTLVYHNDTCI